MTCCMVTCGICRHQNNGVIFIMCILVCFSNAGGLVWILFICFPPQNIADLPINDLGAKSWDSKPRVHLQASGSCSPDAHLELVGLRAVCRFFILLLSERCDVWVGAFFLSALLCVAFAYQQKTVMISSSEEACCKYSLHQVRRKISCVD